MARLNIESKIWKDPRFQRLLIGVGDRHRALGMVVELWQVAQDHWFPARELIPLDMWEPLGLNALVECGLAEKRAEGIYARGADEQFDWLFKHSKAGKKGAAVANAKRWGGRHGIIVDDQPRGPDDHGRGRARRTSPSSSCSSSSSKKRRQVVPSETTSLWDFYSKGIEAKGLTAIHEGAKTNKLCLGLVRKHGFRLAQDLVEAFLRDRDPFVADKAWSLGLLVSQQQKYLARAKTLVPKAALFGEG